MAYTTINKSSEYFNTVTWSGNSSNPRNITGVGFQPDLVWGKIRSDGGNHYAIDVVRGSGTGTLNTLNTDDSSVEQTNTSFGSTSFGVYTSFDSDGFTVNAGSSSAKNTNETGQTYVAWNWRANGSGVSNTDGDITSTVSASTTSGFSIVKWTGTGSDGTIGHGLGVAPKMVIVKSLANTTAWMVYHASLGNAQEIYLNDASASGASSAWNSTTPTDAVISLDGGSGNGVNASGDYIAYVFAEKKSFSKFGSYTGNGNADGTFVYTGFKPAFIIIKNIDDGLNWVMLDNKRPSTGQNPADDILFPNTSDAESSSQTDRLVDFVSNGVKIRATSLQMNGSGNTHIFMAFAEEPLVGTNNIPATAR
jgi:hypothetical protein